MTNNRRTHLVLGTSLPAALLLALGPIGTAHADDDFEHLREVMKAQQPVQSAYDDLGELRQVLKEHPSVATEPAQDTETTAEVLSRLVIAAHAASVRATLADLAKG
jgi:hypothetical protein